MTANKQFSRGSSLPAIHDLLALVFQLVGVGVVGVQRSNMEAHKDTHYMTCYLLTLFIDSSQQRGEIFKA